VNDVSYCTKTALSAVVGTSNVTLDYPSRVFLRNMKAIKGSKRYGNQTYKVLCIKEDLDVLRIHFCDHLQAGP